MLKTLMISATASALVAVGGLFAVAPASAAPVLVCRLGRRSRLEPGPAARPGQEAERHTTVLSSSHYSILSHPKEIAAVIEDAVKAVQAQGR